MSTFTYQGINLETDPFQNASTADEDSLVMLVNIQLWSDGRASDDDVPPDGTESRRGWWEDAYEPDGTKPLGSLLWLLDRSVLTQDERNLAKNYAEQALASMVDDGLAAEVEVEVQNNERNRLDLIVTISQSDGTTTAITYQSLWDAVR